MSEVSATGRGQSKETHTNSGVSADTWQEDGELEKSLALELSANSSSTVKDLKAPTSAVTADREYKGTTNASTVTADNEVKDTHIDQNEGDGSTDDDSDDDSDIDFPRSTDTARGRIVKPVSGQKPPKPKPKQPKQIDTL